MRPWIKTALVGLACVLVLAGARGFWWAWQAESFHIGGPGERLTTSEGVVFRLNSFQRVTERVDGDGDIDEIARPGATFVVAHLSVVVPVGATTARCSLRLIGADTDQWINTGAFASDGRTLCDQALASPGTEHDGDVYFEVPDRYLDQIRGIAIESDPGGLRTVGVVTPGA
ncbi:MAG: hypothetical protein LBV06_09700 [Propionibacteriaceae bacterium]|jgi:hypothetical protein|nr:hypothetical protein [Propionibacteriaceae bacterium]